MSSATAIASDCGPRKKQLVAKQEFLSLLLLPQVCPPFSSSAERDRKRPLSCGKPEAAEAASSVVVLCRERVRESVVRVVLNPLNAVTKSLSAVQCL